MLTGAKLTIEISRTIHFLYKEVGCFLISLKHVALSVSHFLFLMAS